jgi:MFS family permease
MSVNFNPKKFLTATVSFATFNTALICSVLIPFFRSNGIGPLQLSLLLTVRKIVRIFTDLPFGILFDRFGGRTVLFIARISKIISFFILLLEPSFKVFFCAMIFDGLSYSALYGKVNAYIYNHLSIHNHTEKYARFIAIYYMTIDVVIATFAFAAAVLLKYYGYNILIYLSIAFTVISLPLIKFLPKNSTLELNAAKASNFKEIFATLVYLLKYKRGMLYLLLFYGLGNFAAWQFGSVGSMILLDMQYSPSAVAFVGSAAKAAMAIGCLLPILYFKHGITIKSSLVIFIILLGLMCIASVTYNSSLFVFIMLLTIFSYTLIEVSIEKEFEKMSDPKIRGTVTALGWFFCSILTSFSIMFIGYFAERINCKLGFVFLSILLFSFIIFLATKLLRYKEY